MGIFLLCIPLLIFIAVEGLIIYELIKIITTALTAYGFSNLTATENVYPSFTAMLMVLGLIIAVGIMIWVYIRFALISAVRDKNKRAYANEKQQNAGGTDGGEDYIDYMEYMDSINGTKLENYADTRKKNKIKAKKNKSGKIKK